MGVIVLTFKIIIVIYFSVIITNFNRSRKCLRAVNSVLNQTYNLFECVVVDDCSTDDSLEQLHKIVDERLTVYSLSKNIGQANILNKFIPKLAYDWVAILDSDDYWDTSRLKEQVKQIMENQMTSRIFYCASKIYKGDTFVRNVNAYIPNNPTKNIKLINFVGIPSRVIIHKQAYIDSGGFDSDLPSCKDWDCWVRVIKKESAMCINEYLVYYEETEDSVSSNENKLIEGRIKFWNKNFDKKEFDLLEPFIRRQFVKTLISRGFKIEARKQMAIILKKEFRFINLIIYVMSYMPTKMVKLIYKLIVK